LSLFPISRGDGLDWIEEEDEIVHYQKKRDLSLGQVIYFYKK